MSNTENKNSKLIVYKNTNVNSKSNETSPRSYSPRNDKFSSEISNDIPKDEHVCYKKNGKWRLITPPRIKINKDKWNDYEDKEFNNPEVKVLDNPKIINEVKRIPPGFEKFNTASSCNT